MIAGEYEVFSPNLAATMIGQISNDGWTVIEAENEGRQTIWLTIEKDLDDASIESSTTL